MMFSHLCFTHLEQQTLTKKTDVSTIVQETSAEGRVLNPNFTLRCKSQTTKTQLIFNVLCQSKGHFPD